MLFEALDGALGLALPAVWADMAPKRAPKWLQYGPKIALKMDSKKDPKIC